MGIDTIGTLCYGINLGSKLPWTKSDMRDAGFDYSDPEELKNYMALLIGGIKAVPVIHPVYLRKVEKTLGGIGMLVNYCDSDEPEYLLYLVNTRVDSFSFQGRSKKVNFDRINKKALAASEKLLEVAKKIGVRRPKKPSWFLSSDFC